MREERDDRTHEPEVPDFDIPAHVPIKRIKRELQAEFDKAYLALCDGKKARSFTHEQQAKVVETILEGHDLNRYRREIASRIATQDRQQRHAAFGKAMAYMARGQFDLFTEELAQRVWIGTEEKGTDVPLAYAKWSDLQHKLVEQRDDFARLAHTIDLTEMNLKVLEPLMRDDAACCFGDALRLLGHWTNTA